MKQKKEMKHVITLFFLLLLVIGLNFFLEGKLLKPLSNGLKDFVSPIFQSKRKEEKNTYTLSTYEKELEEEIKELKAALDLKQTLIDYEVVTASMLYRNMDTWNQELTIDKGSKDGIEVGSPVLQKNNLIGRVKSVSKNTSTIELLCRETEQKMSDKIELKENHYVYALLSRYDSKNDTFLLEGISENIEIPNGSIVTTTGMGSLFPGGLYIGKTIGMKKDHFDLSSIVTLKSEVSFEDMTIFSIIKRKEG